MDMLPKLLVLHQPLMTRSALDALTALCSSDTDAIASVKPFSKLLEAILTNEAVWEAKDANAQLSLLKLIETGLLRCADHHCQCLCLLGVFLVTEA